MIAFFPLCCMVLIFLPSQATCEPITSCSQLSYARACGTVLSCGSTVISCGSCPSGQSCNTCGFCEVLATVGQVFEPPPKPFFRASIPSPHPWLCSSLSDFVICFFLNKKQVNRSSGQGPNMLLPENGCDSDTATLRSTWTVVDGGPNAWQCLASLGVPEGCAFANQFAVHAGPTGAGNSYAELRRTFPLPAGVVAVGAAGWAVHATGDSGSMRIRLWNGTSFVATSQVDTVPPMDTWAWYEVPPLTAIPADATTIYFELVASKPTGSRIDVAFDRIDLWVTKARRSLNWASLPPFPNTHPFVGTL
jgi:hypothetical protein